MNGVDTSEDDIAAGVDGAEEDIADDRGSDPVTGSLLPDAMTVAPPVGTSIDVERIRLLLVIS